MLAKYATAVGRMKDATKYPPTDPRSWNFQWYTHWIPGPSAFPGAQTAKQQMISQVFAGKPATDPQRQLADAMWDNCQAHSFNPSDPNFFQEMYFCNWHRHYVYQFEEIIRGVLNDQTFTLPYWNYLSGNVGDLSIPAPVPRHEQPALSGPNRNPWVNNGERIDKQNPGSLSLDALLEPTYIDSADGSEGFCPLVDGNPHGLVHVLDRQPDEHGQRASQRPTTRSSGFITATSTGCGRAGTAWRATRIPPWPNRSFPFANAQGQAVSVPAAKANRTALLNYQYDGYATVAGAAPAPTVDVTGAAPKVTRAFASAPVTLGSDRAASASRPRVRRRPPPPTPNACSASRRRRHAGCTSCWATSPHPPTRRRPTTCFIDLPDGRDQPGHRATLTTWARCTSSAPPGTSSTGRRATGS